MYQLEWLLYETRADIQGLIWRVLTTDFTAFGGPLILLTCEYWFWTVMYIEYNPRRILQIRAQIFCNFEVHLLWVLAHRTLPSFSLVHTKWNSSLRCHKKTHATLLEERKPFVSTSFGYENRASRKGILNNHEKAKPVPGRVRNLQCHLCLRISYDNYQVCQHITTHVKEERCKCKQCEFETHTYGSFRIHFRQQHDKSTVKIECPFPGRSYSTMYRGNMRHHQRTHKMREETYNEGATS